MPLSWDRISKMPSHSRSHQQLCIGGSAGSRPDSPGVQRITAAGGLCAPAQCCCASVSFVQSSTTLKLLAYARKTINSLELRAHAQQCSAFVSNFAPMRDKQKTLYWYIACAFLSQIEFAPSSRVWNLFKFRDYARESVEFVQTSRL